MSTFWWLTAAVMVLGMPLVLHCGSRIVEKRTGRETRPQKSLSYDLTYFGICLGIGMPPIFVYPDNDPLFYAAFLFAGVIIGALVAQAFFGRRRFPQRNSEER